MTHAPHMLVERTLSQHAAYRAAYQSEIYAVSHWWEDKRAPDTQGVQQAAIIEHVRADPSIKLVWYDYWSMPHGERSAPELVRFKGMLGNVNMLYLGYSVLVLLDISYPSRFWTQFEAWLSMQRALPDGLGAAPAPRRRAAR
mmetsp:Transcript_8774/g.19508  ORF Transcript_8774/g.19508 Transcript_8774/m.19508 type:complete len:142 (+) Transcript_8774:375-800(+)